MTPADLRALLHTLDLSQPKAAEMIGVGFRTLNRWCSPGGRPPRWVSLALRQAATDAKVGFKPRPPAAAR